MKKTTTTIGALKNAIKRVVTAVDAKVATITVSKENAYVEATGVNGYAKVMIAVSDIGDEGSATITNSAANAVLGHDGKDVEVTLTPAEGGLVIRFAGSRLKLKTPTADPTELFSVTAKRHKRLEILNVTGEMLKSFTRSACKFAARRDVRGFLCGVHFATVGKNLKVTATTGFALHQLVVELENEANLSGLILPIASADAIGAVFSDSEAVGVSLLGENLMEFKTDDMVWVSNLIAGQYPSVDSLLQAETLANASVKVSKADLLVALGRVQALAEDRYAHIEYDAEGITIKSLDGEQVSKVAVSDGNASADQFGVTMDVFIEAVQAVPSERFVMKKCGIDIFSKIYFRPLNEEGNAVEGWLALAMPANL